jgi:hypothetical protein
LQGEGLGFGRDLLVVGSRVVKTKADELKREIEEENGKVRQG